MPQILPNLSAEHPGSNEAAETFNKLDPVSRRAIAWNMGQNIAMLPALLGYLNVLRSVVAQGRTGYIATLSACFGLLVLWGMSGMTSCPDVAGTVLGHQVKHVKSFT